MQEQPEGSERIELCFNRPVVEETYRYADGNSHGDRREYLRQTL